MEEQQARNEVVLVGRLAAVPEDRELPSGDVLTTWRLVVDRPAARPRQDGGRSPTVDTLECMAFAKGVRRTVSTWSAGDVVQVEGALRRRFWRAGAGPSSRCEVEVAKVKRVSRGG